MTRLSELSVHRAQINQMALNRDHPSVAIAPNEITRGQTFEDRDVRIRPFLAARHLAQSDDVVSGELVFDYHSIPPDRSPRLECSRLVTGGSIETSSPRQGTGGPPCETHFEGAA